MHRTSKGRLHVDNRFEFESRVSNGVTVLRGGENMTEPRKSRNDSPQEVSILVGAAPLESILCTEELRRRPSRPPGYEKENQALDSGLTAPFTLHTIPEATLKLADCGEFGSIMSADGGDCEELISAFARAGINVDASAAELRDESAKSFVKSWNDLITGDRFQGQRAPAGHITK